MILTISQYIEALTSTDGRLRTLERLRTVCGADGLPVFVIPGRGLVDFEVETAGGRCTLRCPLRWNNGTVPRLRTLAGVDRGRGGREGSAERFPTSWRVLEREIVLFDEAGRATEVDILARPASGATLEVRWSGPDPRPEWEEFVWDGQWGLATVMEEGRWWLADRRGEMLTTEFYDWLGECSEGLVLGQKGSLCGFLDTDGREAIPFIYDDASSFSEGCALVSLDGENFYINTRGERI